MPLSIQLYNNRGAADCFYLPGEFQRSLQPLTTNVKPPTIDLFPEILILDGQNDAAER